MENKELAAAWVAGLLQERRGSNMRADAKYIWSYNMVLGGRYPEGYFIINNEDYSQTTAHHRSIVRSAVLDVVGYNKTEDKVINVSSRWNGSLPTVGDVLQSQVFLWLPQPEGHNWGTLWGGATPAAKHFYPEVIDNTTGRIKAGLWGGDPQALRIVLGATGGDYDMAVLEHLAVDSGLDAAANWLTTSEPCRRWHIPDSYVARLLLCYGATTFPAKSFDGYTGKAWDTLMACPPVDRPALASEMLLRKNHFFADAAKTWLRNYNAHKEVHT